MCSSYYAQNRTNIDSVATCSTYNSAKIPPSKVVSMSYYGLMYGRWSTKAKLFRDIQWQQKNGRKYTFLSATCITCIWSILHRGIVQAFVSVLKWETEKNAFLCKLFKWQRQCLHDCCAPFSDVCVFSECIGTSTATQKIESTGSGYSWMRPCTALIHPLRVPCVHNDCI